MQSFRFEPPFYDTAILAECSARDQRFSRMLSEGLVPVDDDQCWQRVTEALRRSLEQRIQYVSN